jgi:hypothetical protein
VLGAQCFGYNIPETLISAKIIVKALSKQHFKPEDKFNNQKTNSK